MTISNSLLLALFWIGGGGLALSAPQATTIDRTRVTEIVNEFEARLDLHEAIRVNIVPHDAFLFSVQPPRDDKGAYVISCDRDFLALLNEAELRAALAHEMGHIWIYTHHPYLQTEELANQIALRLVTRADLEQAYRIVHQSKGQELDTPVPISQGLRP